MDWLVGRAETARQQPAGCEPAASLQAAESLRAASLEAAAREPEGCGTHFISGASFQKTSHSSPPRGLVGTNLNEIDEDGIKNDWILKHSRNY